MRRSAEQDGGRTRKETEPAAQRRSAWRKRETSAFTLIELLVEQPLEFPLHVCVPRSHAVQKLLLFRLG